MCLRRNVRPWHIRRMTLDQWMTDQKVTDAWLAERVGTDRSRINRIRRGLAVPSLRVAVEIERVTRGKVKAGALFPREAA